MAVTLNYFSKAQSSKCNIVNRCTCNIEKRTQNAIVATSAFEIKGMYLKNLWPQRFSKNC